MKKVVVLVLTAGLLSGCGWEGLNSLPLPGAKGGENSYEIKIQMPNVTTLTQNSPVRVNDVTVGSVRHIDVEGWHALVTVALENSVHLPANATAKVGQTSLLGSNHIELAPPTDEPPAQAELKGGDVIPLDRAGAFPTTEQTLSSLSVVLNGGGLAQINDITRELDAALTGRAGDARDLLNQLDTLATGLDNQRGDIVAALDGLDRLTKQFADQRDTLAAAIEQIHPALQVLVTQRQNITTALTSLGQLSDTASRIIRESGDDLKANLANLAPVLKSLADTDRNLVESLKMIITFPFPMQNLDHVVKGDYANLMMTVDLTGPRLDSNFLTGTPLGGSLGGVEGLLGYSAGTAGQATDPIHDPLKPPPPAPPAPPAVQLPGLPPIQLPQIPGLPGAPR